MLDAENSKNRYLNSGLSNIRKTLGSGKMSFIVTTNDPHNPEATTKVGAIFNNVLKHADTVKYITPPSNPHDWLLKN